jgi:uncharacterized protein YndB with AHSA1/START domain
MKDAEASDSTAGFTLSRVLSGTPPEVFAHFTEPPLFCRWFIVERFATPAARVNLDPRPGGTIRAVMVPDEDGPEIPLAATYGIVDHNAGFSSSSPIRSRSSRSPYLTLLRRVRS